MIRNHRKFLRREVRYTAWVLLSDGRLHGCVMSNASDEGACLEVDDSEALPNAFTLLLSSSGKAKRKCRVVWRKPQRIGVRFEQRGKKSEVMPVFDGDEVRLESMDA